MRLLSFVGSPQEFGRVLRKGKKRFGTEGKSEKIENFKTCPPFGGQVYIRSSLLRCTAIKKSRGHWPRLSCRQWFIISYTLST